MTYHEILEEYMLECPIEDMRYFMFGLIKSALTAISLYENEECNSYKEFLFKSSVPDFF